MNQAEIACQLPTAVLILDRERLDQRYPLGFEVMLRAWRFRNSATANPLQDFARWWPFLLIGPAVVALRVSGPTHGASTWASIPVAVLLVMLLAHRWREIGFSPEMGLLGGFVGWTALSLAWSPDPSRGLRFVLLVAVAYLAYVWGRVAGPPGGGSQLWWAGSVGLVLALAGLTFITKPPSVEQLNPDRILAMGVIAVVVGAWYGPRRRWYTATVGLVGLATVVVSGSRMGSLVVLVLLVTAPGLRLPRAGRVLFAISLVTLVGLASTTTTFQQRWSQSGEGTLFDLITLEDLKTSGRFQVWPVVADACGFTLLGHGAGAADTFSSAAAAGFPEPHNEYLRVWCDTGLVGSLLLWGFLASVALRAAIALGQRSARAWAHQAALQTLVALVLLALSDNPLTTAIPFLVPAALALGWSGGTLRHGRITGRRGRNLPRALGRGDL